MGEIFHYTQKKLGRKKNITSTCDLKLLLDDDLLYYFASFTFTSQKDKPKVFYGLKLNLKSGHFEVTYHETTTSKNFVMLQTLSTDSFIYGGNKKTGFWGVKYREASDTILSKIKEILLSKVQNQYVKNKNYDVLDYPFLYELVVDFHLSKKKIKFHNNVYPHLLQVYPKNNFLRLNDKKFLPAILDEYKIKSKYLIGVLSSGEENNLNLLVLKYLCHLFGSNYIDYIKKIDWLNICKTQFSPKKIQMISSEYEKKKMIDLINDGTSNNKTLSIIGEIYTILELKEFFDSKNVGVNLRITTYKDLERLTEEWSILKKNVDKGYLLRQGVPQLVLDEIEQPIIMGTRRYIPKVLITENDFLVEGIKMKNCMGAQFMHGATQLYISLSLNGKRVDLQYLKGELKQSYGKANSPIKKMMFNGAIKVLTDRVFKHRDLTWETEKIIW